MKKRPLFLVLMAVLFMQSLRQVPTEAPATSIFYRNDSIEDIVVHGQIYKKEIRENYQILYLKNNSITNQNQVYQENYLMAYDDSFSEVKIGQYLKIKGDGIKFEEARNPGNFDGKIYYAKQKMYGALWNVHIVEVEGKEHVLQENLFAFRQKWSLTLQENMGEEKGKILCAILLNEKGDLQEEVKELYQKNGYGHILAISGLHISFIGIGIFHLLRKIGIGYRMSAFISTSVLSLYVIMIGFSVSIFRAFLMLLMRIGAEVTGRVYDMLTAVTLSAAILVIYEPLYLRDASFQLSHGAIYAILFVAPAIKRYIGKEGVLMDSICTSLAIQIALFPITIWWYYEVAVYSILWNLIVIPLMSFLMTLGMMGSFLPLRSLWLTACSLILTVFDVIGQIGNLLPWNRIVLGRPHIIAVILFYGWLVLTVQLSKYKEKYRKLIIIGMIGVIALFIKMPNRELEITMLDVGQGDCIFMKGPWGKAYLVDGGSSDVNQVGKYRIESFLKYKGVGTLDYVFLSHGDQDHYNGIKELIQRQEYGIKIKRIVLPETYRNDSELLVLAAIAKENGIRVACIKQGQMIEEGDLQIYCIQPGNLDENLESNAGSMVLDVSYKSFSMLFTGDVELEGEERLIQNLKQSYQVLKVAHHGSKNATSKELLEIVAPKVALISAGENSIYGHPHKEVLDRLEQRGIKIICTTEKGAITLKTKGNSLTF